MTTPPLPSWPKPPPSLGDLLDTPHYIQAAQHELNCRLEHKTHWIAYERARADAAMARLRVAVEALKVAQQAAMEARHAQEVGPDWYTRGRAGMEAQIVMWNNKAAVAVRSALDAIGELPPA